MTARASARNLSSPVASAAARVFASHSNGEPGNVILEALANLSFTAHLLGGCHLAATVPLG